LGSPWVRLAAGEETQKAKGRCRETPPRGLSVFSSVVARTTSVRDVELGESIALSLSLSLSHGLVFAQEPMEDNTGGRPVHRA